MGLRFGIDIGVASVGWAVVNDEYEVVESGANLFPSADASKNVTADIVHSRPECTYSNGNPCRKVELKKKKT